MGGASVTGTAGEATVTGWGGVWVGGPEDTTMAGTVLEPGTHSYTSINIGRIVHGEAQTLTLFVLLAGGQLESLIFVNGDHGGCLGLNPGGCLGSLRPGLGTGWHLLARGGFGGHRRYQGGQRPAFRCGG